MKSMIKNRSMVNHSIFSRGIKYDYMNVLTRTILKKTQILNGCETFAFKYKKKKNHKWFSYLVTLCNDIHGSHIYIGKIGNFKEVINRI